PAIAAVRSDSVPDPDNGPKAPGTRPRPRRHRAGAQSFPGSARSPAPPKIRSRFHGWEGAPKDAPARDQARSLLAPRAGLPLRATDPTARPCRLAKTPAPDGGADAKSVWSNKAKGVRPPR